MYYAVSSKNLEIIRMLDEYNADALIPNAEGNCPIDIAIS